MLRAPAKSRKAPRAAPSIQRRAYAVYSILTVAQFTFMNFRCSLPRYALCVFPLFLALPELIKGEERTRLWLAAGALLQTAGLTLFVAG